MTEEKWMATDQSWNWCVLGALGLKQTRPWWLFALACIEPLRIWLLEHRLIAGLEVIERVAEGCCPPQNINSARDEARAVYESRIQAILDNSSDERLLYFEAVMANAVERTTRSEWQFGSDLTGLTVGAWEHLTYDGNDEAMDAVKENVKRQQFAFFRDIFGNPFRPVSFSPSWRTDTAIALAQQMYDSRDFSAMPILADAFQDAGCDSDDILNHWREVNGVHVRGCWVVDLVLDKA